jgi:riboflavin transporter FmnP
MFLSFACAACLLIKLDFPSCLRLIASFSIGPFWGAAVCLIKNAVNVFFSTTGGVGELSNFILGCLFVVPAGWFYKRHKTRGGALTGALLGAACMAGFSVVTNYYVVYRYTRNYAHCRPSLPFLAILPRSVFVAGACHFNMPFTFLKGCVRLHLHSVLQPLSRFCAENGGNGCLLSKRGIMH